MTDEPLRYGLPKWSLLKRFFLLLLILALLEIPLGLLAFSVDGWPGVSASMAALLSCLIGGWVALAVCDFLTWLLKDEFAAFAGVVAGMLIRAGIGLAVCALAYGLRLPAARHGLVFYVLAFYMLALAVESWFAIRRFSDMEVVALSTGKEQA